MKRLIVILCFITLSFNPKPLDGFFEYYDGSLPYHSLNFRKMSTRSKPSIFEKLRSLEGRGINRLLGYYKQGVELERELVFTAQYETETGKLEKTSIKNINGDDFITTYNWEDDRLVMAMSKILKRNPDQEVPIKQLLVEYYEEDKIIKLENRIDWDSLLSKTEYVYNQEGLLLKQIYTSKNSRGERTVIHEYEYDENKRKIVDQTIQEGAIGKQPRTEIQYNGNTQTVIQERYDYRGIPNRQKKVYHLNGTGLVYLEEIYNGQDVVQEYVKYSYAKDGLLVLEEYYDSSDTKKYQYEMEYIYK